MVILSWIHGNPIVRNLAIGAISGVGSAMVVDYKAFQSWKSLHDAAEYGWSVAFWRWFQGLVGGVVSAAGASGLAWLVGM